MPKNKKKSLTREAAEVIAAFIIAWVAYQGLAFATGTPLPIVSVVSDSMYHTDHFNAWWANSKNFYGDINIGEDNFRNFPAPNGLSRGDLLFVIRPDKLKVGDVIIYTRHDSLTIVHRIAEIENDVIITKGDNNPVGDQPIVAGQVHGKMVFAVPILGYPRFLLHLVGV